VNEKQRNALWIGDFPIPWRLAIYAGAIYHHRKLGPFVMELLEAGRSVWSPQARRPPLANLPRDVFSIRNVPYAYRLALRQEAVKQNMLFRDYLLVLLWYGMKARKISIPVLSTPAP